MSRYYDDDSGENYPSHWWQTDLDRALTSGRGQRLLRKVETALRALPVRQLAGGSIVEMGMWEDDGSEQPVVAVCAVGAYASWCEVKAGKSWDEAFRELAERYDNEPDQYDTQALGQRYGLARTVAWELGWLNDERFGHLKPRQRWRAMLAWVRSEIKQPESVLP